jgi:hypothetical protein
MNGQWRKRQRDNQTQIFEENPIPSLLPLHRHLLLGAQELPNNFTVVELIIGIVFQQEFLELFQYTKERALFMPFLVVYLPRKSSGLSFTTILATNTSNKAAHTGRAKERLPSKAAASSLGVVIIYRHISFSHQWLIIDPFV